jgi:hypothetical protein
MNSKKLILIPLLLLILVLPLAAQVQRKEYRDWMLELNFRYPEDWQLEKLNLDLGRFVKLTTPDYKENTSGASVMIGMKQAKELSVKTPADIMSLVLENFNIAPSESKDTRKAGVPALYMRTEK